MYLLFYSHFTAFCEPSMFFAENKQGGNSKQSRCSFNWLARKLTEQQGYSWTFALKYTLLPHLFIAAGK